MLKVGTRGSALALAQTRALVAGLGVDAEIVTVESSGSPVDDKSRWTKGLEAALLDGTIDVAVHSAKDVPTQRPGGISTAAVAKRDDPADRLVGAGSLDDLPLGARVGTASPRRLALIRSLRHDLEVIELRGNVDTRLRKLESGDVDALVLAAAGLNRLGHGKLGSRLEPGSFTPAAGQGTLMVECREGDGAALAAVKPLADDASERELMAERSVVAALDADCHTAVGCLASLDDDGLTIEATVLAPDGSSWIRDSVEGAADSGEALALELVTRLRAVGCDRLLAMARGER